MKAQVQAKRLAELMVSVGESMGVEMATLLTPMQEPLGRAIGNALAIAECVDILHGTGPADLVTLILDLAQKVVDVPRDRLQQRLKDGSA